VPSLAADDAFGARLATGLGARGNLVISPASIATALRLALLGARGDTAAELAAVLGLAGPEQAADSLRATAAVLDGLASGPLTLRAPSTLWVQSGLPLRPEFTGALAGLAAVSVHDADFARAAEAARGEINALIAEQTAGKITGLLPPGAVAATTRLVLASAVYLKAAWAHPFPEAATADGPFWPEPGRTVDVPLMRLAARLRYRRGDGYQVVELPYAGGQLAMLIVLPDGGLGPLEDRLAAGGVAGLAGGGAEGGGAGGGAEGLSPRQVSLVLPKFRMTSALDLAPVLTALGARLAFTRGADFSGITSAEPLHIGAVAHKAYIDVDERGTEAAAATAVTMALARAVFGGPPVEVVADRPFLYAITEASSGLPLFLGRVADPSAD
jgi:serpin B